MADEFKVHLERSLSLRLAHVCRWSGLIRGAVSVALVYYHFDPAGKSQDSHRSTLIATTLIEVMTSIFVFGAATKPLLDYLLGPEGMQLIPTQSPLYAFSSFVSSQSYS